MRHAIVAALIACLYSPEAFAASAGDPAAPPPAPAPVALQVTPNGSGDPEAIVCRAPQPSRTATSWVRQSVSKIMNGGRWR